MLPVRKGAGLQQRSKFASWYAIGALTSFTPTNPTRSVPHGSHEPTARFQYSYPGELRFPFRRAFFLSRDTVQRHELLPFLISSNGP